MSGFSVNVRHEGFDRLISWARSMASDQVAFATAKALTDTARAAADELTRQMPALLDRPTPFTMRAWTVRRATKADLQAAVVAKPQQAEYLRWQVYGGTRAPRKVALKLPGHIKLDEFGNIARKDLKQLLALAQQGKRLTRVRGSRLGISSKVDLFYGDPGHGMPPGIYKRVPQGAVHHLVPLVVFPHAQAHYKPRLPMVDIVRGVVRRTFEANFRAAFAAATATAR